MFICDRILEPKTYIEWFGRHLNSSGIFIEIDSNDCLGLFLVKHVFSHLKYTQKDEENQDSCGTKPA